MTAEVLAIIPARSGSKGIPDKNIQTVAGKPVLAHSILHGLSAATVTRVVVSTDSAQYAEVARSFGAETPFLRPAELSTDLVADLPVFQHALSWLDSNENYRPDIVVNLRPTFPTREPKDIDEAVNLLLADPTLDSVRTIAPATETPYKMWHRDENGLLRPVVEAEFREAYNEPRQKLPQVYWQNANVDAVYARVIRNGSMTGKRIMGALANQRDDIDTPADFRAVQRKSFREELANGNKTFCFDIDGVIATITPSNDYNLAQPIQSTIDAINILFDNGHTIQLFTARGTVTGIDWSTLTTKQMKAWGVKYHSLMLGKPAADYYIDDRLVDLNEVTSIATHNAPANT